MVMDRGQMKRAKNCAVCGLQMSKFALTPRGRARAWQCNCVLGVGVGRRSVPVRPHQPRLGVRPLLRAPGPRHLLPPRATAWRKKWEKNWDEVKFCSDRCRADSRRGKAKSADAGE